MTIVAIKHDELMHITAQSLSLTEANANIIYPAIRRAASELAPCSRADLIRYVFDPLQILGVDRQEAIDAVDELLAYGDLLEMQKSANDPWDAPQTILRPAPPSFVLRSPTEAFIIGVAGQISSALPKEFAERIQIEGSVRVISLENQTDLRKLLESFGLIQLSERAWLRTPSATTSESYINEWEKNLLATSINNTALADLEIIDIDKPPTFYNGRWTSPRKDQNGFFVGRRSQVYGSRIWCLIELSNGHPRRLLDLVPNEQGEKPRDVAWRIQAALDSRSGHPQVVETITHSDCTFLKFFSPIPSFAERRLLLIGKKSNVPGCLFRFALPQKYVEKELRALESTLWMRINKVEASL